MRVLLAFLILLMTLQVFAQVKVRGYYRKDGTYVRPHYRYNPDGNPYNNWSYPGNTNPYTGKTATGNPDTYLKNYYNRSSGSSSPSSYSYPSTTYSTPNFENIIWKAKLGDADAQFFFGKDVLHCKGL
ncbi:MAG: hypothetical protein OXH57_12605 [Ekhidna sp.]|nr:hypothetical protein [Ekhidna sp.]